jgi:hypothetical protein
VSEFQTGIKFRIHTHEIKMISTPSVSMLTGLNLKPILEASKRWRYDMRIKKPSFRPPRYPSHRQFLAALGIGAFASVAHADTPPPPPGVPPFPRDVPEQIRLRGDIAEVPLPKPLPAAATLYHEGTRLFLDTFYGGCGRQS